MVTSNVEAVYDSHVGNHARFGSHDVVNFVFSVSIRASPCPSPPCFLNIYTYKIKMDNEGIATINTI